MHFDIHSPTETAVWSGRSVITDILFMFIRAGAGIFVLNRMFLLERPVVS